jgi:hypothetical protein
MKGCMTNNDCWIDYHFTREGVVIVLFQVDLTILVVQVKNQDFGRQT